MPLSSVKGEPTTRAADLLFGAPDRNGSMRSRQIASARRAATAQCHHARNGHAANMYPPHPGRRRRSSRNACTRSGSPPLSSACSVLRAPRTPTTVPSSMNASAKTLAVSIAHRMPCRRKYRRSDRRILKFKERPSRHGARGTGRQCSGQRMTATPPAPNLAQPVQWRWRTVFGIYG